MRCATLTRIGPYEIASPWILAPMAGVSERPFRVLARKMGAGLAPTELVSAKGLEHGNERTERYLAYDRVVERPYAVQLFGGEPDSMARAAEIAVRRGADILDINMGCPVRKVTKTGAGSALLCDPARAAAIVRAMTRATGRPVTAKIRAGWDADSINAVVMARALEDGGAAAIALHARTRAQGYSGAADWSLIAAVKRAVAVPVIGNGDVASRAAALRMLAETGCDFVMIGRAALGNPWIFRQLSDAAAEPPSPGERLETVVGHLRAHVELAGDERRAVRSFRQHLLWYSRGLRGASAFRERATRIEERAAVEDAAAEFFAGATCSEAEDAVFDERRALG